jgi:DNA-binding helix-hairpin-helix protein with protein kinase domain
MSVQDIYVDNRPLQLGRRIGRGGEGDVYELAGEPASAIKIYTIANLGERESKVSAMVANGLAARSSLASFPNAIARDRKGRFLGFKMKLVRDHKPLHELYAPGPRKLNFPQADYRFLVRAAANLARAVAEVHQSGCVIGDLNHSGALISPKATAALIDADSFQFGLGGQIFKCAVGVPEYTPPELQGKALGSVVRTTNHDCFGLAVIVFQLLFMGRHPFIGTIRRGDLPPLHEAIRDYRFVYTEGRNVGMDQPPGTPALSDFPDTVGKYFEVAFGEKTKDKRPTAMEWVQVLDTLEGNLAACTANKLHFYPRDSEECPWCYMESQLATVLFVPYVPGAKVVEGVDPGAAGFNIDAIWRLISAVHIPQRAEMFPTSSAIAPPTGLKGAEKFLAKVSPAKIACAIGAIGLLALAPPLWFISVGLGVYAIWGKGGGVEEKAQPLRVRLSEVENRWHSAVVAWQKRNGVEDFLVLRKRLEAARSAYLRLDQSKRREIDEYKSKRRERHLHAFLDNFQIRNAKIKGIGVAKQAALASYGVDSAADITAAKVLAVPGVGPALAKDLVAWRRSCEARFAYSDVPNQTDAQELSNINAKYLSTAAELRRILSVGPANLSALESRVRKATTIEDSAITKLGAERDELKQKLKDLGVTPPAYSFEWPSLNVPDFLPASSVVQSIYVPPTSKPRPAPPPAASRPISPSSYPAAPVGVPASPSCPRCSSTMVRRIARRGRNAGGSFWGCSRYPVCRGTRNI